MNTAPWGVHRGTSNQEGPHSAAPSLTTDNRGARSQVPRGAVLFPPKDQGPTSLYRALLESKPTSLMLLEFRDAAASWILKHSNHKFRGGRPQASSC